MESLIVRRLAVGCIALLRLSKRWEGIDFWAGAADLGLLNDFMPRFKPYDYGQDWMVSISFAAQLPEGSLEYAFHHLIEERVSEEWFEELYANDEIGRPAYSPKLLLERVMHFDERWS